MPFDPEKKIKTQFINEALKFYLELNNNHNNNNKVHGVLNEKLINEKTKCLKPNVSGPIIRPFYNPKVL